MKGNPKYRIAYLHAKKYHPAHGAFAESVNADFIRIDKFVHYFEQKSFIRFRRVLNWLVMILRFDYKSYNAIITDGPDLIAVLLKLFSFNRIKLISTQANKYLVFYHNKIMPKRTRLQYKKIFNLYDLIICLGNVQLTLAKKITEKNQKVQLEESFNGVGLNRIKPLETVTFNPRSNNLISVSNNLDSEFWKVKGIDIILKTFNELSKSFTDLRYIHIGPYQDEVLNKFKNENPDICWDKIRFVGRQMNLKPWFSDAVALLQLSRTDAFPVTVTESFIAGLPTFISTNVGVKSMYKKIPSGEDFMIETENVSDGNKKLNQYLSLSENEKSKLSLNFKQVGLNYNANSAKKNYNKIVFEFLESKNIGTN